MVAYSFKPGFLGPIRALEKRQSIRLPRKRHAHPGEQLQFFTGPRMRPTRIGGAQCIRVANVRLDFTTDEVEFDDGPSICGEELNEFAIRDGFNGSRFGIPAWEYMSRWWALTHPGQSVFRGVLIDWADTFTAVAP